MSINDHIEIDISLATPADYFALMKPRVMRLVVFTALVGMLLAPGSVDPVLGLIAIVCIAIGAGASGALNMWYDADIDSVMSRTTNRPIPSGRVTGDQALNFGMVLSVLSVMTLGLLVNWLAAAILAFTIVFYAVIYTMWLKRSTPQNIVIGGLFGAAPPLFGWTAVTGSVDGGGLLLVLIIFAWTPPHFWALAIDRMEEYRDVDIPMLPVTHGAHYTKVHILLYTIIMVITSVLPFVIGMSNILYLISALALGAGFIYWALVMLLTDDEKAPMETFRYSIFYLMALFVALLVDHYLFPVTYIA